MLGALFKMLSAAPPTPPSPLDRLAALPTVIGKLAARAWGGAGLAACWALMSLSACASLPARQPMARSEALAPAASGPLATALLPAVRERAPLSGFIPLESGLDAFAARLWLVDRASSSLDVQCYIWRADRTGRWLLERMRAAAERGVRVRLLLDDNNGSAELDALLTRFDAHRLVEVRLFNPYPHRGGIGRIWDLATDFKRLNRRMHNKVFTADGLATTLGGRNSGDEYFGHDDAMQFSDLDVLAVGPVVLPVAQSFDAYWNSASAYPLAELQRWVTTPPSAEAAEADARATLEAQRYATSLADKPRVERWRARGPLPADFSWGKAGLVVDPPDKVLDQASPREMIMPRLERVLGRAERSVELVSPYFVPDADAVAGFRALRERGVRVRVLTNSLAATDVAAVHAGYAERRRALLAAGVELYEFKPKPGEAQEARVAGRQRGRLLGFASSSEASLHAKSFVVDSERVFIGSLNFDPRSEWLNTEIGLVIEHAGLAKAMSVAFDTEVPQQAWRVSLDDDALRWTTETDAGSRVLTQEPETGWLKRAWVWLLSLLPIDWLL